MKTKILALTGIRSEYDLLYPLLKELDRDSDYELGIIVSGAHLSPLHNYSIRQIEQDGFEISEKIESLLNSDTLAAKSKSAGILMQSLSQTFEREKPDFLIVLGDREESIVGALTASYMNIPVIHLAGGDNTNPTGGNVDEQVRHATSKLSHVHLTMRVEHSDRLIKLGEEPWRIHTVGSGGTDRIRMIKFLEKEELEYLLNFKLSNPYAVLIHHPLSSDIHSGAKELELILRVLKEKGIQAVIGHPNSDPGSTEIIKLIEKFKDDDMVSIYNNLDRNLFINLLRHADILIGNSSLGLHEAPYLCLPAINVGERQRGRLAGNNVLFVDADKKQIKKAIDTVLNDEQYKRDLDKTRYIYGDGFMSQKAIEIIKNLPSKEALLSKKIMY